MAKLLTPEQRARYDRMLRNKGKAAAEEFKAGIVAKNAQTEAIAAPVEAPTEAPAAPAPAVDINDPMSVIDAQRRENAAATIGSTPNVETTTGSRAVTVDPATGQATVKETLSPEQQALYDQRVADQKSKNDLATKYQTQAQGQGAFNYEGENTNFRDIQERSFNDALSAYDQSSQRGIAQQRSQIEQQLANEGISPGTAQYENRMRTFTDETSRARERVTQQAYGNSVGLASQAQAGALAGNAQGYSQAYGNYMIPHDLAGQYGGSAGGYDRPELGAVQSMSTNPVDIGGTAIGFGNLGLGRDNLALGRENLGLSREDLQLRREQSAWERRYGDRRLAQDAALAREGYATSRATAGAGSIGVGGQIAVQNARHQNDLDLLYAQQAAQQATNAGF